MAFIGKLFNALMRSRDRVSNAFQQIVKEKVSLQSLEQLEETLIASDLGLSTVDDILDIVKKHSKENFINEVAGRLTTSGAIYLGLISTLPFLIIKSMGIPFYFGGVAVLIVVQVALDTMRKIEAQVYMNKYDTLGNVGL